MQIVTLQPEPSRIIFEMNYRAASHEESDLKEIECLRKLRSAEPAPTSRRCRSTLRWSNAPGGQTDARRLQSAVGGTKQQGETGCLSRMD
jgi:hypothetical protein